MLVRYSTRSSAASWLGLSAAMPQQLVNCSVPLPAGSLRELGDDVLHVGEVVGHRAGDPVALDRHRGQLLAERLAAPAGADVLGVGERAGVHLVLDVREGIDVLLAVGDRLAVVDEPAAGLRHERADALVLRIRTRGRRRRPS